MDVDYSKIKKFIETERAKVANHLIEQGWTLHATLKKEGYDQRLVYVLAWSNEAPAPEFNEHEYLAEREREYWIEEARKAGQEV